MAACRAVRAGPEINANIRVAQMVPPIECDLGYRFRPNPKR